MSKWKKLQIKDIGRVITGRTPPGTLPEHFGGEIPFITPTDMDDRRFIDQSERSLSYLGAQSIKGNLFERGVAVSCIGWQMGKSIQVDRLSATNQQINSILPDEQIVDINYLYYEMSSRRDEFFRLASGGSRTPILKKSLFESLDIYLPPLPEQQAIARILGALDDKIELNRRMNHTLEEMVRALFKSWFVDFDPVTAKAEGRVPFGMNAETASLFPAEFEKTGDEYFSETPKGWILKNLDDVADYENGLALQKFRPEGIESLPAIKIRELRQGFADESSDRVSPDIKASCILEDGDVVFSWSGSLMIDLWCGGKGALNQHLFKVTSEKYPKWFYYFWTEHHLVDFQDIAEGKATTMGHIQRHHITSAKVVVPSDDVLEKADKVFQPLLNSIIKNRIQIKMLATIRDALLPKLLSGELRVKNVAVGEVE